MNNIDDTIMKFHHAVGTRLDYLISLIPKDPEYPQRSARITEVRLLLNTFDNIVLKDNDNE